MPPKIGPAGWYGIAVAISLFLTYLIHTLTTTN